MENKTNKITWETMAEAPPKITKPVASTNIVDECHFHLARIMKAPMSSLDVKERCGRLVLVEFIPSRSAQQQRMPLDPVLVLPLFQVSETFDKAFLRFASVQQDWVAAGGMPYSWATRASYGDLETMTQELQPLVSGTEVAFWDKHMRRIVSQPARYLPLSQGVERYAEAGWLYLLVLAVTLVTVMVSMYLIST